MHSVDSWPDERLSYSRSLADDLQRLARGYGRVQVRKPNNDLDRGSDGRCSGGTAVAEVKCAGAETAATGPRAA